MDTPLLIAHLPIFFGFVVKQELMRIPIFRGAMRAIGCVAVSRRGSRRDHAVLDSVAVEVKGGKNVLLFPEGSRSPTDEFLPFKKGGVVLAIKAQVPILPVAVSGTNRVLSADRSTLRPGPLLLRIGSPISTSGLGLEDRERLLDEVQSAIVGLYQPSYKGDTPEEVLCESPTMS
jgi:1-acyl-sn-glycerol-3-phosphate acyltransferase